MGVAEYSPDPMLTMDLRGNIMWFNAAAARAFGHRRTEARYMSLGDLLTPEAWTNVRKMLEAQVANESTRLVVDVQTSDGRILPHEMHFSLMQERGSQTLVLGVARDIGGRDRGPRMLHGSNEPAYSESARPDRRAMIKMCAWCRRVRTRTGEWVDVGELAPYGNLTHGMCSICLVTNPFDDIDAAYVLNQ